MKTPFLIFELLCKQCWRWQYLLQGERNWFFHTSEP